MKNTKKFILKIQENINFPSKIIWDDETYAAICTNSESKISIPTGEYTIKRIKSCMIGGVNNVVYLNNEENNSPLFLYSIGSKLSHNDLEMVPYCFKNSVLVYWELISKMISFLAESEDKIVKLIVTKEKRKTIFSSLFHKIIFYDEDYALKNSIPDSYFFDYFLKTELGITQNKEIDLSGFESLIGTSRIKDYFYNSKKEYVYRTSENSIF